MAVAPTSSSWPASSNAQCIQGVPSDASQDGEGVGAATVGALVVGELVVVVDEEDEEEVHPQHE